MKKPVTAFVILLTSLSLSAQYKKASFFGKEGRTYEFATQLYVMGDGKGSPVGIKLAFGRDKEDRRFFSSWELHYIPSYKYSFETADNTSGDPVTVSGKSKSTFIYALNYGFHLLKNDDPAKKIKPFVAAGLDIVFASGIKTETRSPESYDTKEQPVRQSFNLGLQGGLGCLFNFTEKWGLKVQAGYSYQYPVNLDQYDDSEISDYHMFTSNVYLSVGLRLRVARD